MSKWEKYKVTLNAPSSNRWSKYQLHAAPGDLEVFGKATGKGISTLADLPKLPVFAADYFANQAIERPSYPGMSPTDIYDDPLEGYQKPQLNMASHIPGSSELRRGIKNTTGVDLEPNPSNARQRILANAGEFGGSLLGGGALGAAAKVGKVGKSLLGRFSSPMDAAKQYGVGLGVGGTSGALQEEGVNPLVADLTASFFAPFGAKKAANFAKAPVESTLNAGNSLIGLNSKNHFNLPAAQAARDLGIDLPADALTDAKLAALGNEYLKKLPVAGDRLRDKYLNAEKQSFKALNDIFDRVGQKESPEVMSKINRLYDERTKLLPKDAQIAPTNLNKALDSIKINSATLSPSEKDLLVRIKEIKNDIAPTGQLETKFGKINVPLQPYPVERLVDTKRSLNSIIKWDTDEGVKNLLRKVQKGIVGDIEEYGATNPEWYKKFKEADQEFGKVARREKLENFIGKASLNPATESLSYNPLSRTINAPANQKKLQNLAHDPEIYKDIKKLGEVAKALSIKSKNIPNPSGTASTAAAGALLGWLAKTDPLLGGLAIGGGAGVYQLLTNKKFVDLAIKNAEKGATLKDYSALEKMIKDRTGLTLPLFMREVERLQQEGGNQ